MRHPIETSGRLVAKVGSSSLVGPKGVLDPAAVERVAGSIAAAWHRGHPTVLVSSGAVASGLSALGLRERPTEVADLQVAAAVGQGRLMHLYSQAFESHGLVAGQILLTRDVLANREQYLHARQAMGKMLSAGIVPVVNENDTVVVDELKLGDNDRLAAIVAHLVRASLMVLFTDTEGLFDSDPRLGEAEFLHAVDYADERLDLLRGAGPLGSGGVASKVAAARMAAWSSIPTVVAAADASLLEIVSGEPVGTWVAPRHRPLSARKLWISFCNVNGGTVTVDDGAATALVRAGKSLLPVGVTGVHSEFVPGDTVDIRTGSGQLIGRGLTRMGAGEIRQLVGTRGAAPVVHRDDLVVFQG